MEKLSNWCDQIKSREKEKKPCEWCGKESNYYVRTITGAKWCCAKNPVFCSKYKPPDLCDAHNRRQAEKTV
jgi:hypothetical protein